MNLLSEFLTTLATPGDQPYNWYAWIDNQMGHAMLGTLLAALALFLGAPPLAAFLVPLGLAVAKELLDLLRRPLQPRWLRDSAKDVFYWAVGALLAVALWAHDPLTAGLAVLAGASMAVGSILPRMRAGYANRLRHQGRRGAATGGN